MYYPQAMATADSVTSGAGATTSITYAAVVGTQHVISGVSWSYSSTPTGGSLKIEDGLGNTIFYIDITAASPDSVNFIPPKRGTTNRALVVTLTGGGGSIVGKLNILGHWTITP